MTARTWIMMTLLLGLNWGGFIFLLWYSTRRARNETSSEAQSD